jgi:hypothetical protein
MADFEVNIEGDVIKQFGTMKKDVEKLARRAITKSAKQTEEEISRLVDSNKLLNMGLKTLKKSRTLIRHSDIKSGIDGMKITLIISDRPQNSYRFWPSYATSGGATKSPWRGTIAGRAGLLKGENSNKTFFIGRFKTMYYRKGEDKYPFVKFKGPSLGEMFQDKGLDSSVARYAGTVLQVNFSKALPKAFL